jgi:hypothetical protein
MRDVFGADAAAGGTPAISEGGSMSAVATPPVPTAGAAAPAAPAVAVAAAKAPTMAQAVDKAVAKAASDAQVAVDPHAVHHVKLAVAAPTVLGSTAAGALIGSAILPGPGTAVGALVGWAAERYQIGGGLFGKAVGKIKGSLQKVGTLPPNKPV